MFYQHKHLGTPDYLKKESGENFSFPHHLHQCFELIIIQEGEMEITVDKNTYNLQKNQCVLVFPNQIHSLASKKSKHVLFVFSPKIVQAFFTKKIELIPENNKFILDDYLLDKLLGLSESSSTVETKGLLYTVCAEFDKCQTYMNKNSDSKLLSKIFSFVDANHSGDCSLKSLARFLGYDYAYISRFFKEATGISYNDYINMYRLNNAGYIFSNSAISILECSIACGYKSLRSFNRNFKEYYGISPKEYKRQNNLKYK